MGRLLLRYFLLIAVLAGVNFALPRFLPGSPLDRLAADGLGQSTGAVSARSDAALRSAYQLDQPIGRQFQDYLSGLMHGSLGWSPSRGQPVLQLIADRLPWTLLLVGAALVVGAAIGIGVGGLAAWRREGSNSLAMALVTGVASVPEFLIAVALLLLFSVTPRWLPLQGLHTPFIACATGLDTALDTIKHLALPVLALALPNAAVFALLTWGAVDPLLTQGFITSARARGLPEGTIRWRHVRPNATGPVMAYAGLRAGQLVGGAIVAERVFSIPGLGLLAFQAIQARDYPVLQAVFMVSSLGVLLFNLAVDLLNSGMEAKRGG